MVLIQRNWYNESDNGEEINIFLIDNGILLERSNGIAVNVWYMHGGDAGVPEFPMVMVSIVLGVNG